MDENIIESYLEFFGGIGANIDAVLIFVATIVIVIVIFAIYCAIDARNEAKKAAIEAGKPKPMYDSSEFNYDMEDYKL